MAQIIAVNSFEIQFPDSPWAFRITRLGDTVSIDLYWGGKDTPTHSVEVATADFAKHVNRILED